MNVRSFSLTLAFLLGLTAPASALGTEALIYRAPTSISYSYGGLAAAFREAGATNVLEADAWPTGVDFAARFKLIVVTTHEGTPDPSMLTDLAAFVAEGGGVVIIAEHDRGGDAGNTMAEAVGASARFEFSSALRGCNGLDAAPGDHPLTRDAPVASVAWGQTITGGTVLYSVDVPMVVVEGTVVLAGDSDLFADASGLGSCSVGDPTRQFYRNLFTDLADESGGMMMGGDAGVPVGPDAGVGLGGVGAQCSVGTECAGGICASDGDRSFCTQTCTSSAECPASYECAEVGVCAASAGGGGGCSVGGPVGWSPLVLLALFGALTARRRRRG